ncbi:MAG: zinc ribbon domain-containing protein [Chloroflexi bacterium]|nr:MAG: zinc ribbon domain-containing protein [Chloroflexota bacterium]
MNCTRCNMPLEPNARFCRNCGTPVSMAATNNPGANPAPPYRSTDMNESPTLLARPQIGQQPPQQMPLQPQPQQSYYQPTRVEPTNFSNVQDGRPRRRRGGCLIRSLITFIVLLVLIVGGWFFGLQPYLNKMAHTKLDETLTEAVNNIPPPLSQLPAGPVSIPEKALNNLLVLQSAPNDIVKNPQIHITSTQARMEFQVYGFPCAVTGVPQANSGHLTLTNVNIEGIAALILTPDEITTLVNRHLADAQTKLNHSIDSVQLKDQEVDLVLGPGGSGVPPLP